MFQLKEKLGQSIVKRAYSDVQSDRALLNGHIVMSKMNLNFKVLEYQREEKMRF